MGAVASPNPQTKEEGLTGPADAAIRPMSSSKVRRGGRCGTATLSPLLWEDSSCHLSRGDENRWK